MLVMKYSLSCCIVLLMAAVSQAADDGKGTYTDPKTAPASLQIQGEYEGVGKENETYGAQIIALGDGKFHLISYQGGLPSATQSHKDPFLELDGEMKDGKAIFDYKEAMVKIVVGEGKLDVVNASGETVASINRQVRKSPTLGAKPPQDAIVLFDGGNADAFVKGQVDDGLLLANCFTKETFGDHHLHLEFRTPYKPAARGQGRGNSGVYVQSRYEVQVLDSFGLSGESNECGGIYKVAKPNVNMCFPPLQWQTYDIDFTAARYNDAGEKTANARITVRHNGVVIHDDIELPKHTPGRNQEGPKEDALYLQGHGNPVYYRNIWVVKK